MLEFDKMSDKDRQKKIQDLKFSITIMFKEIPKVLNCNNLDMYNKWINLYINSSKQLILFLGNEINFLKNQNQNQKQLLQEKNLQFNDYDQELQIIKNNNYKKICNYKLQIQKLRKKCNDKDRNIEILICIMFFTNILIVLAYETKMHFINQYYDLIINQYYDSFLLFLIFFTCFFINNLEIC